MDAQKEGFYESGSRSTNKRRRKKYLKAKEDILQAAKSFSDLLPQWQDQLSKELLEAAKVLAIHQIMQRHLG